MRVLAAGPALFLLLLTGRQFPVVGFRQLQTPTCRGSTHCTSVATASPRTVCPAVGSSRNTRKVWVTLPIPVVYVNEDPVEAKHRDVVLAGVSLVL